MDNKPIVITLLLLYFTKFIFTDLIGNSHNSYTLKNLNRYHFPYTS